MNSRNNRPSPFFNMGKKSNASNNNTFNFKMIHTLLIILLIIIVIYIAITAIINTKSIVLSLPLELVFVVLKSESIII